MATIKNGGLVTSTATEQELTQDSPATGVDNCITCQWISGTYKITVSTLGGPNVLTGDTTNFASQTLVTDKSVYTVDNGKQSLRVIGVGTFRVTW